MKAKNNLDLFINDIIYEMSKGAYIYDVMMNIYLRESGNETRCTEHMLKWFADVPRETLELNEFVYDFIETYYSEVASTSSIDSYIGLIVLLKMNIIPKKYSSMLFSDFIKIIRKKEKKK